MTQVINEANDRAVKSVGSFRSIHFTSITKKSLLLKMMRKVAIKFCYCHILLNSMWPKFRIISLFIITMLVAENTFAQQWRHYTLNNSDLPSNHIRAILITPDGVKWFGSDKGLSMLNDAGWRHFSKADGLTIASINDLAAEPAQNGYDLWIAGDQGVNVVEVDLDQIRFSTAFDGANSGLPANTIRAVAMDPNRAKWFGTDRGAVIFHNNKWLPINKDNYLSSNLVRDIASDKDGLVHIATKGGGVSRLKLDPFDVITAASTVVSTWSWLQSDTIHALLIDGQDQWCGTGEGAFRHTGLDSKLKWRVYQTLEGLIDNHVQCIAKDSSGQMWFGTPRGVSALSGETFTNYNMLISNNVLDIAVDRDGAVWCATDSGISVFSRNTTVRENSYLPEKFDLTAFPNPFQNETTLQLQTRSTDRVDIRLYDINGRQVRLFSIDGSPGRRPTTLRWNGFDDDGKKLPSGLYVAVFRSGEKYGQLKLLMVK